jgi:hypothetical protein
MPPPDQNGNDDVLTAKLEELESLLDNDESNSAPEKIQIPVLDELITDSDLIENEEEEEDVDLEQMDLQITELAEKLEQKFSGELDQLVHLLKDNIKNSIVEELRTQANIKQNHSDTDDDGTSDEIQSDKNDREKDI